MKDPGSDIGICDAQSHRMLKNQGLITKQNKISVLIDDWKNNIVYMEEPKQSKTQARKCDMFNTLNSWWVWEPAAQLQESFRIYTLIYL